MHFVQWKLILSSIVLKSLLTALAKHFYRKLAATIRTSNHQHGKRLEKFSLNSSEFITHCNVRNRLRKVPFKSRDDKERYIALSAQAI